MTANRGNYSQDTRFARVKRDYDPDRLLALLPEPIKQFVLYECPANAYLPSIMKLVAARGQIGALKFMRERIAEDSLKVYGAKYPARVKPVSAEDLGL